MKKMSQLIEIMAKVLNINSANITPDSVLESIENWDSLSALRVLYAIETEAKIKIPLYQFLKIKSMNTLFQLVRSNYSPRHSRAGGNPVVLERFLLDPRLRGDDAVGNSTSEKQERVVTVREQ